jgi:hypothetical protein
VGGVGGWLAGSVGLDFVIGPMCEPLGCRGGRLALVLFGNFANLGYPEVGEVYVCLCVCVSVRLLSKLRRVR